jgi:hypothetical protein
LGERGGLLDRIQLHYSKAGIEYYTRKVMAMAKHPRFG